MEGELYRLVERLSRRLAPARHYGYAHFKPNPTLPEFCPPTKVTTKTKGLNTFPLARMTLDTLHALRISNLLGKSSFNNVYVDPIPVPPHLCPFHSVTMGHTGHRGGVPLYLLTRDPGHGIRLL